MTHRFSVIVPHLGFFQSDASGLPLNGANLATVALLRHFAAEPGIDRFEVFVPPLIMMQQDRLAEAARGFLPPDRFGAGFLHFYPLHSLPEVWADGAPRILFCMDPDALVRDRYLRDRFATGPTPIVCDTHALGLHRYWGPLSRLARAPHTDFDSIAALSEATRETLRRTFSGFLGPADTPSPCRLDVIPRAVDTERFIPSGPERRAAARSTLGLPQHGQIALYFGRVSPYDKADLLPLVRTFAAAEPGPEDILLIAGAEETPGYADQLRTEAAQLGIAERVLLHPNPAVELTPLYYAAADLFVFPGDTIQECFGNTVIEAMASGLPVIASDWDGFRDTVVDGETGILVPTYWIPGLNRLSDLSPASPMMTEYLCLAQCVWIDTDRLAQAIRTLLRSADLRARMGAAARARAEQHFSWPAVLEQWRALWAELLEAATRESESSRAVRRDYAATLGLPTPYLDLHAHYATGVLRPDTARVRLTASGRAAFTGKTTLRFYDETVPLLRQEAVDAVARLLLDAADHGILLRTLASEVERCTRVASSDVLFHLALMLKQGLLAVSQDRV